MIELFQRNFDLDGIASERPQTAAPPAPELLTPLEVSELMEQTRNAAFKEGVAAGQEQARSEQSARLEREAADIVAGIAATLDNADQHVSAYKRQIEHETTELMALIFDRVFPDFLAGHAESVSVAGILAGMKFTLASPNLHIRVPTAVRDRVELALSNAGTSQEGLRVRVEGDETFQPGAFELNWTNGRLEYDLDRACNEVMSALRHAAGESKPTMEGGK